MVLSNTLTAKPLMDGGQVRALGVTGSKRASGMPDVPGLPGAYYERPSDEHGSLNVSACNLRPELGDKVLLIPGHCDPTINLHDWYIGVRGLNYPAARVESVWPIAARGALF